MDAQEFYESFSLIDKTKKSFSKVELVSFAEAYLGEYLKDTFHKAGIGIGNVNFDQEEDRLKVPGAGSGAMGITPPTTKLEIITKEESERRKVETNEKLIFTSDNIIHVEPTPIGSSVPMKRLIINDPKLEVPIGLTPPQMYIEVQSPYVLTGSDMNDPEVKKNPHIMKTIDLSEAKFGVDPVIEEDTITFSDEGQKDIGSTKCPEHKLDIGGHIKRGVDPDKAKLEIRHGDKTIQTLEGEGTLSKSLSDVSEHKIEIQDNGFLRFEMSSLLRPTFKLRYFTTYKGTYPIVRLQQLFLDDNDGEQWQDVEEVVDDSLRPRSEDESSSDNTHGDLVLLIYLIEKLRKREGGCIMNELVAEIRQNFTGLEYIKSKK